MLTTKELVQREINRLFKGRIRFMYSESKTYLRYSVQIKTNALNDINLLLEINNNIGLHLIMKTKKPEFTVGSRKTKLDNYINPFTDNLPVTNEPNPLVFTSEEIKNHLSEDPYFFRNLVYKTKRVFLSTIEDFELDLSTDLHKIHEMWENKTRLFRLQSATANLHTASVRYNKLMGIKENIENANCVLETLQ